MGTVANRNPRASDIKQENPLTILYLD